MAIVMTMATTMMAMVTAATMTTMTAAMVAVAAKKTKVVTHRQQSTKIGSRRNIGGGVNGNGNDNCNNDDGDGDSDNDDDDDGSSGSGRRAMAATDGMVWGRHQAARGGGNGNKVEMGTMWV
jgi:hypothetical protein